MWQAWERRKKCERFWWETPKERNHLKHCSINGRMGSEWILGRLTGGVEWVQLAGSCEPSGSGTIDLLSRSYFELLVQTMVSLMLEPLIFAFDNIKMHQNLEI
jgi:hypothetical protein